ncbi:hypothetical protein Pan216_00480 [Planctomycetes bacterium Pan216]|uniref:DUF1579 domain-containing protein n=1 Tax=Kolteria novifilia TaxID=2527975 RepID=A0A518AWY9_9BACT|nr:hypothetical protein Pan216_00480 [Planctomycetes bacterium Pan216]
MFAKPQKEHEWLAQLVGEWTFVHECEEPDGKKSTSSGTISCRMLGGLWLIVESSGEAPDHGPWSSIMTLGFDPAQNQFVGTFIGSMMANIWPYHGVLDESGKRLPLNSHGPKCEGSGTCNYRDTIELVDNDRWLFLSELQDDEGNWTQFMTATQTRS